MEDPVLEVRDLSLERPGPASSAQLLDGVSLRLPAGQALGVVGEAGSGKSLLVRAILGVLPRGVEVASGCVYYRGRDILAMQPQELVRLRGVEIAPILPNAKAQLNPLLRVERMIRAVIRAHAGRTVSRGEAHQRAIELLRTVQIPDPERRLAAYPHELSGGMAQRVCIALALSYDPSLIVADEPTSGLDVTVQRQVLDLMSGLAHRREASQLFVTRDLGIVAHYCQTLAVMRAGRVIEQGATVDVFDRPREPYTQRLIEVVQGARTRQAELTKGAGAR